MQVEIRDVVEILGKKMLSTTDFWDRSLLAIASMDRFRCYFILSTVVHCLPILLECYVVLDEWRRRDIWSRIRTGLKFDDLCTYERRYYWVIEWWNGPGKEKKNTIKNQWIIYIELQSNSVGVRYIGIISFLHIDRIGIINYKYREWLKPLLFWWILNLDNSFEHFQ